MQDILDFEKTYKGSDEEKQDVIKLYVQHEGDMDVITAFVLCYSQEDEPRICSIIQDAIDGGEVEAFPAFTQESRKKKNTRRKKVSAVKPSPSHASAFDQSSGDGIGRSRLSGNDRKPRKRRRRWGSGTRTTAW